MAEIIRHRTIRPSSRLEKSKTYKINTEAVCGDEILLVNIYHETKSFQKTFTITGFDVAQKDCISFKVNELI